MFSSSLDNTMHIITGLNTGGAESYLVRLLEKTRPHGGGQPVISLQGEGFFSKKLTALNIPVIHLDLKWYKPHKLLMLIKLIRKHKPSHIQSWLYHADLLSTLCLYLSGRRSKTKLFWGIRCSNMNFAAYSPLTALTVKLCAYLSRLPDQIIANSHKGKDIHTEYGYSKNNITVVHNGIDTDVFKIDSKLRDKTRKKLGYKENEVVLLVVGRVDPMKGHPIFLEAFNNLQKKAMSPIKALLIGKGTKELPLPANTIALDVQENVVPYYNAADIIVCPSLGEGFPNALAEGMSCGCYPVTTIVGDAKLITSHLGKTCIPNSPNHLTTALKEAIGEIARNNSTSKESYRKYIVNNFSLLEKIADLKAAYSLK